MATITYLESALADPPLLDWLGWRAEANQTRILYTYPQGPNGPAVPNNDFQQYDITTGNSGPWAGWTLAFDDGPGPNYTSFSQHFLPTGGIQNIPGSGFATTLTIYTPGTVLPSKNIQNGPAYISITGLTANLSTLASYPPADSNYPAYIAALIAQFGGGNDTINGSSRRDFLRGYDGNDTINGNGGNDTLYGMGGLDTLRGGLGDDEYLLLDAVGAAFDTIVENAGEGTDTVRVSRQSTATAYTMAPHVEIGVIHVAQSFTLRGNEQGNQLYGNTAADTLEGGGGDDFLHGGAGLDTLRGGAGNDTYELADVTLFNNGQFFGESYDTVEEAAGAGSDTVRVGRQPSSLFATPWTSYELGANVENGIVTGTEAFDLTGNALNNTLTGNDAANVLSGFAGDDWLDGNGGRDTLVGGPGSDTYVLDDLSSSGMFVLWNYDTVTEAPGEGIDTVIVTTIDNPATVGSRETYTLPDNVENATLAGSLAFDVAGNDLGNFITGNAAANSLGGAGGNDVLIGGPGADSLDGGIGIDSASYAGAAAGVTADLQFPNFNSNDAAGDTYTSIENIFGSSHTDSLRGDGLANTLGGGAGGNDFLDGRGGNDFLAGGIGNDTLAGGDGIDTAAFDGARATYNVRTYLVGNELTTRVADTGATGTDTLTGIEKLQFANMTLDLVRAQLNRVSSVDGDRFDDVLFQHAPSGQVLYARMIDGAFQSWGISTSVLGAGWQAVASGNVNPSAASGGSETFVQQTSTGSILYASQDTGATVWGVVSTTLTPDWKLRAAGDVNGDAAADVIVQNQANGAILYADMKGGVFQNWGVVNQNLTGDWLAVGTGDLNRDGFADVVVQQQSTGTTFYAKMVNGAFAGWGVVSNTLTPNWKVKAVADVTGDGFAEVIFQNTPGGGGVNPGTTYYADVKTGAAQWGVVATNVGADWLVQGTADVDNDGRADVLFQNLVGGIGIAPGSTFYAEVNGAGANNPAWGVVTNSVTADWQVV